MSLNSTSLAAAVGSSVKNVQFQPAARNLERKIGIFATYDPAKTSVVDEVPVQVFSPADVGDRMGFGFMAHRLAVNAFAGGKGVSVYVIPQSEAPAAAASTGSVDFTGSTGVLSGVVRMYIAGQSVAVNVATGATEGEIATAVSAAVNANAGLPASASITVSPVVDITAKSKGPWGDKITIKFNINAGESLPTGVTATVTAPAGGSGVPTMADALNGLGTGDFANEVHLTDVVHGYGTDATTLTAISAYVGAGNDFIGLYAKTVARPFRALTGDTVAGSTGLSAILAISGGRLDDRANGVVSVPGSANHPSEIAALAIGVMAGVSQVRPEQSYIDLSLAGVDPGVTADRWTSAYDSRDNAVKSGVSPTTVTAGVVKLQNVVSFYRPASVPVESNGYRSMRNIAILQNLLENIRLNFTQEKWQGISIVSDTKNVTDVTARIKARDTDSVRNDLMALALAFAAKAWLFEAGFTIGKLKLSGAVTVRGGGTGFDNIFSVILSGEGGILDTVTEFDTNIAVLTA